MQPIVKFQHARFKRMRAAHHVDESKAIWQSFLKTDFCKAEIVINASGLQILTVKSDKPLPVELLLSIGDAIHNMRAALDYVVSEILDWKDTRLTFPMAETREELATSFRTEPEIVDGKTKGKGRNAALELAIKGIGEFFLDQLKPYKSGNDTLWSLGKLDNTDKHRLLIPTVVPLTMNNICAIDNNRNSISGASAIIGPGGVAQLVGLGGSSGLRITSQGKATAEIKFNEVGVCQEKPVFTTLQIMLENVDIVIERLGQFVSTSRTPSC
jgi:hypothetical protein